MTRSTRRLLALVVAELIVGGVVAGRRLARPAPPRPDPGRLDPAAAELRARADACESAEEWRELGELSMADGHFRESEMCHRVACRLGEADVAARQWAFALERLALLDEANVQYRRVAARAPDQADACAYFVGRNLLRADRADEARSVFATGSALAANRYELARLHVRAGRLAEAEAICAGLRAEQPQALQIHLLGYRIALERGDRTAAFARADDARYATGKLVNPFDEEALRVIRATAALGNGRRQQEARDLIQQGRLDRAESVLREVATADPEGTEELFAEVALRRGRFADAAGRFATLEARGGTSARFAARAGDAWEAAAQPEMARACWLRAVQLGGGVNLKDAHHKLARSFALANDRTAADRHLARGHYYVGRDLLKFGYPEQAIGYFAAAARHDATFADARYYLGEARRRAGQPGPAAEAYRDCLKLDSDHGRAHAALAALGESASK